MRLAALWLLIALLVPASAVAQDVEKDFLKNRSRYKCLEGPSIDTSYGKTMTVYVGKGRVAKIESEATTSGRSVRWDWFFDAKGVALVNERVYLTVDEAGRWLPMPVLDRERRYWLKGDLASKTPDDKKKRLRRDARKLIDHYRANIDAFKSIEKTS